MMLHEGQPFDDRRPLWNVLRVEMIGPSEFSKQPVFETPSFVVSDLDAVTSALERCAQIPRGVSLTTEKPPRLRVLVNVIPFCDGLSLHLGIAI